MAYKNIVRGDIMKKFRTENYKIAGEHYKIEYDGKYKVYQLVKIYKINGKHWNSHTKKYIEIFKGTLEECRKFIYYLRYVDRKLRRISNE